MPQATARTVVPPWRTRKLRCRSPVPIRRGSPSTVSPAARNRGRGFSAPYGSSLSRSSIRPKRQRRQRHLGVEHQRRRRRLAREVLRRVPARTARGRRRAVRRPHPEPRRRRVPAVPDQLGRRTPPAPRAARTPATDRPDPGDGVVPVLERGDAAPAGRTARPAAPRRCRRRRGATPLGRPARSPAARS